MAININTNAAFTGRITAPDANYTYGSSKDETGAGAGDGTPYLKVRADDIFGWQQALLRLASIVPTGNAETQLASQYVQAQLELAAGRAISYDESGIADAYVLDIRTGQQTPPAYFDGMRISFRPGNANTGASTVNVATLGVKNFKTAAGVDPTAGDLPAGGLVTAVYDSVNGWFELGSTAGEPNVLVQSVFVEDGAVATGGTIVPFDDTIPQNTEGTQFMSLSITPKDAANFLEIDVVCFVSPNNASFITTALFKDAIVDAIAAGFAYSPGTQTMTPVLFTHRIAAGSTSTQTFNVRSGSSAAVTNTFNGVAAGRKLGGVVSSSIRIREVTP